MGRVRYARSLRDLEDARGARRAEDAGEVRALRCVYETDAEAVAAVVPRPLSAAPLAEVEVAIGAARTGSGARRLGAMLGVRVDYAQDSQDAPDAEGAGARGLYPLSVPVDDAEAVIRGRERFGEPRKHADLSLEIGDADVSATIARHAQTIVRATGRRVATHAARQTTGVSYGFKAFPSCDASKAFDQDPQLVRIDWRLFDRESWRLEGGLELWDSPFDPIADLPVRRLVSLELSIGRFERSARVLRPVPGEWLAPFLHQRDDAPEIEGVEV